jgi:hypothetical protein
VFLKLLRHNFSNCNSVNFLNGVLQLLDPTPAKQQHSKRGSSSMSSMCQGVLQSMFKSVGTYCC